MIFTLWRRRRLFVVVFAATLALTAIAFVLIPVRYLASGSVIFAEPEPGANSESVAWVQKLGDPADMESQLMVIRSPRMLRLAMSQGVLDAVLSECRFSAANDWFYAVLPDLRSDCSKLRNDDLLLEYLQRRYTVSNSGRSRVVSISYQSPLPETAQTLANALITAFLDDQRANLARSREAAASWIWTELRQLDASIQNEDDKIQAFRRRRGLVRGSLAPISSERLTSIGQQLSAAEAARADAAARLKEVNADRAGGSSSAPAVLASRSVGDLKQQLTVVTGQISNMASSLGPNHPGLKALRMEQDNLNGRLATEIASIAASLRKTYDASDALANSLRRQMDAVKAEVASATDDEASIASMVRSSETKRSQYAELYKRASVLETERRVLVGSTRLVSLAELPSDPFFPKRLPFLAAGLTLACVFASAAALLRDRGDGSVRTSSQLLAVTSIPVFAQLRLLQRGGLAARLGLSDRQQGLPLKQALWRSKGDPAMQDALRGLHARLLLAGGEAGNRKILVTSAEPREGKSFTTLALAQFSAASGRRVLVIECDLRRPAFADALGLKAGPGLSGVLGDGAQAFDTAVVSLGANLDMIPAGEPTVVSTELLMRKRMADLLDWARSYDLVLLDSPPANLLMDAYTLSKLVDGVLCCARWGQSQIAATEAAVTGIRAIGGEVLGLALTMVQRDRHASYELKRLPTPSQIQAA